MRELEEKLRRRLVGAWQGALAEIKNAWEALSHEKNLSLASALLAMRRILQKWPDDVQEVNLDIIDEIFRESFKRGILNTELKIAPDEGDMNAVDWITHQRNGFLPAIKDMSRENIKNIEEILKDSYTGDTGFDLDEIVNRVRDETEEVGKNKAELIVRTETAKISALGRIYAWGKDSDRDWYNYWWLATPDDRVKDISLKFEREGPYDYDTIKRIWEKDHNEPQRVRNRKTGKMELQISAFNCRCTVARSPKTDDQLLAEGKISSYLLNE